MAARHRFSCGVCAQQRGERLAETLRVLPRRSEILGRGEAVSKSQPAATSFATDLDYRGRSAEIRVLLGEIRVKAERHNGGGLALTVQA